MRQFAITIPRTHRQIHLTVRMLTLYAVFVVASIGFVKIAKEVHEKETLGFDDSVLTMIHQAANPFIDTVVPLITNLGGPFGTIIITVLLLCLFWLKQERRRAALVFLSVTGAVVLNTILKAIFERPRPDLWDRLVVEHSYSFPSGHAMASAALGLALVAALWSTRWRVAGVVCGLGYMVVISATRLYLGVHYPTDVIAGWMMSAAWVAVVTSVLYPNLGRIVISKRG